MKIQLSSTEDDVLQGIKWISAMFLVIFIPCWVMTGNFVESLIGSIVFVSSMAFLLWCGSITNEKIDE